MYNMLKNHVVDCRTIWVVDWAAKSIDCSDQAVKIFHSSCGPPSSTEQDPLADSTAKRDRIIRTDDRERYVCSICKLHFGRSREYKRHMVKHSDLRPYTCALCNKTFKRSSELANHKQLHRGIEYKCEVCGFTTNNKFSVRTHYRRVHQRDFRYHCDQCDKSYMSNSELEDHKASHLGKKTFVCEICGNAYLQKSYLVAHRRAVHKILKRSAEIYQCDVCSKKFPSEQTLRTHLTIHSKVFLCALCGNKFATNQGLKMHNRRHTGERPYVCKVCSKAFTRSTTLRVHELTHTGERPYICDLCGQTFTQRSSMMVHRRKHPGNHPRPPPLILSTLESDENKL